MTLLDDLSGFEFEDVMEDVFRKLGYQNVRQSEKTGDEGRDILMEERLNGQRRGIVVECKHTDRVGRPVVQKLHSAVTTYDFPGPKRGIIVTTGSFTDQAREYTHKMKKRGDGTEIQLIDGSELREMAEDVGLDLYNGRIEIICDQTLRPIDPAGGVNKPVRDAFQDIANFDARTLSTVDSTVRFEPVVSVDARTNATFETSVGVIHRVDERDSLLLDAGAKLRLSRMRRFNNSSRTADSTPSLSPTLASSTRSVDDRPTASDNRRPTTRSGPSTVFERSTRLPSSTPATTTSITRRNASRRCRTYRFSRSTPCTSPEYSPGQR